MSNAPSPFRVISHLTEEHSQGDATFATAGQCDCDCDCAIPVPSVSPTVGFPSVATRYQPWPGLYTAPLNAGRVMWADGDISEEGYALVFNSVGGVPAVLNSLASRLLAAFAPARSIGQVITDHPDWHPNHVRQASAQLAALALLRPAGKSELFSWGPPASDTLAVWLHVTNQCNLRCDYCYLRKNDGALDLDTGRRAIDAVFRSATRHHLGRVKLKYAGGEASLNAKTLLSLHDYAAEQACRLNISLNAVLLSNGVALSQSLIRALRGRGIQVMISLDGVGSAHDAQRKFPNGHGSFVAVARTLDRLQVQGVTPFISLTVSARNLDGLPDAVAYLLERDLPFGLYFYRENECSGHRHDLRFEEERLIQAMDSAFDVIEANLPRRSLLGSMVDLASFVAPHRRTCGVGQNYLVIDQRGMVSKCQMEVERPVTSIAAEDPLGVVQTDQIGLQNPPVDEKEDCRDCIWRYGCTGGCPLATYRATGRYDVKSPNCRIYQALYPRVLRLEGLRLLRWAR